ncbi:hypothetical protein Tco_0698985 [Tanacetum coccineum]
MSVHNSERNTPNNSDHDDDFHDSVTRISKLDISDPLHLHPNDTTALTYDVMIKLPKYVCNASEGFKKHNQLLKLMQFIMGLDDSYMHIRSSILSRETLPDVRSVYATISSEESHSVAVGSIVGSSQRNQASFFVFNVPYSQNFQRSNQNFNVGSSRPNNVNNNRQGGGSGLNNNKASRGSGLKKFGQNFKIQSVSNNNSVRKSSSSGFTDEQMATLISLIKDNKVRKNVQANMAADRNLRELSGEEAWETIKKFAQGQKEWDNPPNIISEQEIENLKVHAKRLFRNENVWVEMHKNIAWDKVENLNPQSTPQVPPSFEKTTPSVTHPKEVDETIGIPTEVEPLDYMKLEDIGLNTCSHDLFLSSRELPSVDESEPQLLPNFSHLDVNLRGKRGTDPYINPYSPSSFRMKVIFDEKKLGSS